MTGLCTPKRQMGNDGQALGKSKNNNKHVMDDIL